MLNNVPVKKIKHGDLTIEGYSRAAVQSYWRIAELKLGFDLGAHPWDFMGTPTWLLSHCHLDHVAALPLYVARRRLMKMAQPRVYVPESTVGNVRSMLDSFERLDRGRLPCELIGMESGQEYELSRELVFTAHKTVHRVPSLGFIVYERRKKLKPEFAELTGEEIKELRQSGTEVTHEIRIPLIGYTGDTAPRGLDNNPEFYKVKVLITEMTFIAPDHRRHLIHKNGHMHLDDFVERADKFENELIIASHFSTRYIRQQAEKIIKRRIPDMLDNRLKIWL
jgi:ribonuclease Z